MDCQNQNLFSVSNKEMNPCLQDIFPILGTNIFQFVDILKEN